MGPGNFALVAEPAPVVLPFLYPLEVHRGTPVACPDLGSLAMAFLVRSMHDFLGGDGEIFRRCDVWGRHAICPSHFETPRIPEAQIGELRPFLFLGSLARQLVGSLIGWCPSVSFDPL